MSAVAQDGQLVTLTLMTWQGPLPHEGDFLRTESGSCYQIERFHRSRPGSKSRGRLYCRKLARDAVADGDPGVFRWSWVTR